ncbi:hypothetical protein [Pseudomonas syringae]|uniref:hypothetical protein n=1 Tax=Pseudomonas syringae TaxID=317 RepID=UPI00164BE8E4|nr:hypothetical protein [Pseudomonas syringae]
MSEKLILLNQQLEKFLKDKNVRRKVIGLAIQKKLELEGVDADLLTAVIAELNRVRSND